MKRKNACLITIHGHTRSLTEWCEAYRISKQLVIDRISRGWSDVDAVTKPVRKYRLNKDDKDVDELSPAQQARA